MYNYSVLMSVYFKEKPEYLYTSMESMFQQTIPTNDFVLVCDGELTEDLERVINEMEKLHGEILNVIRLPKNGGLGNALNEGMKHCKNDLIARMDSDDISKPYRCEEQLAIFKQSPELSIVSATIEEFDGEPEQIIDRRILPEIHEQIIKFAKRRNPFNHPCVMYKKSDVMNAGGYQDFYLLEDYFLWIRMLMIGKKGYNIQNSLLLMRAGNGLYNRRSGKKYAVSQKKLFQYMFQKGFINLQQYILSVAIRSGIALVPTKFRKFVYRVFLRK